MTYNIHKGIGGVDRRYRLQRIVDTVLHYQPDIVFLQEVDDGVPRSQLDRQVDRLGDAMGYEHRAFQANVRLTRGHYGNAILSHFPLSQSHDIDLTIPLKKRRRALLTVAEMPLPRPPEQIAAMQQAAAIERAVADREAVAMEQITASRHVAAIHKAMADRETAAVLPILLSNVHLGLAGFERSMQLRRLLRADSVSDWDPAHPVLLGGDFNDVWGSLGRRLLLPHGFQNASGKTRTFPAFKPFRSLDSIYYRGPLQLQSVFAGRIDLARQASDHLPLIADFQLAAD